MNSKVLPRLALTAALTVLASAAGAEQYLVIGSGAPDNGTSPASIAEMEQQLQPTFEALMKLEADKKIVGGMPVGDRTFTFILEASSNDEADRILRDLPAWRLLKWEIKPLQSFQSRAEKERSIAESHQDKVAPPDTTAAEPPAPPDEEGDPQASMPLPAAPVEPPPVVIPPPPQGRSAFVL